jgi:tRNA(fMet)-specific endonuclease VapC
VSFLLDTCVVSELVVTQPNQTVVAWMNSVPEDQLYLSVLTIGELKRGVDRLAASRRQRALQDWLQIELVARFARRLLPLDAAVMFTWGALMARLEQRGRPLPAIDSLMAATAVHYDLSLATRNVRDFEAAEVRLVNPWEAGA